MGATTSLLSVVASTNRTPSATKLLEATMIIVMITPLEFLMVPTSFAPRKTSSIGYKSIEAKFYQR